MYNAEIYDLLKLTENCTEIALNVNWQSIFFSLDLSGKVLNLTVEMCTVVYVHMQYIIFQVNSDKINSAFNIYCMLCCNFIAYIYYVIFLTIEIKNIF